MSLHFPSSVNKVLLNLIYTLSRFGLLSSFNLQPPNLCRPPYLPVHLPLIICQPCVVLIPLQFWNLLQNPLLLELMLQISLVRVHQKLHEIWIPKYFVPIPW
ncbi:hypothetical protein CIPAW_10G134800 [Carya illinoinensis]|uniref:Uncharacterized protein n=1 Tax=Carya illinoinensis TaxID=32201 RepID=A0A8T1PH73_CARIL|nr:hypothetical protein CIPAW_10G134800 [Carya illinoinensis]